MSRSHTAPPRLGPKSTGPPDSPEMGGADACNHASSASTPAADSIQIGEYTAGGPREVRSCCCSSKNGIVNSVIVHENDKAALRLVRVFLRVQMTAPRNHRIRCPLANFPMANPAWNIHSRRMAPKCSTSGTNYVMASGIPPIWVQRRAPSIRYSNLTMRIMIQSDFLISHINLLRHVPGRVHSIESPRTTRMSICFCMNTRNTSPRKLTSLLNFSKKSCLRPNFGKSFSPLVTVLPISET